MSSDGVSAVEAVCLDVYAATRDFYAEIEPSLGNYACGFKILYGPPYHRPPLLFLGFQPGGGKDEDRHDVAANARDRWPETSSYLSEDWPLARSLLKMFGNGLVSQCVGLNAIFLRSPRSRIYRKLPLELRDRIARFCLSKVAVLVDTLEPRLIVIVGFETAAFFGLKENCLLAASGRVLARVGYIHNAPAIATLHLSGARISKANRADVAKLLVDRLGSI